MATQQTYELKVDTGAITVPIIDNGEEIGRFRFNPSDWDIIRRFEKTVKFFEGLQVKDDMTEAEFFEITDGIKTQFDFLLNYEVSGEIFGRCNPLSLTSDGDTFVEVVLEGIAGIIEKVTDQRLAKKSVQIKKATAKYHK